LLQPGEEAERFPHKYGYCVFGEVFAGMEVLEAIAQLEVSNNGGALQFLPKRAVIIKSAERVK
jgi:cyclophilin family peptidyl-prolyl cis-trans isomerase